MLWQRPYPRIFSNSTDIGVKILPLIKDGAQCSRCIKFRLQSDGSEEVLWERELTYLPAKIMFLNDYVIALDTYGRALTDHGIVVFGVNGEILVDLNLETFLSNDEIQMYVAGEDWSNYPIWTHGMEINLVREKAKKLSLRLKWDKLVYIDIHTGEVQICPPQRISKYGIYSEKRPSAGHGNFRQHSGE